MFTTGRQDMQRFRAWKEEMLRSLYTPLAEVSFNGFTTTEELTPAEAESRAKVPFPKGTRWGANLEYGWFSADVTLPAVCEGRRVIMTAALSDEQLIYVNGRAVGSVDKGHGYVTLTRNAKAGETFHLLAEAYAGHGARLENIGFCPPERKVVPPVPEKQCTVGACALAVWEEEAYQLALDVITLESLLKVLPDKSLRAQKVAAALTKVTYLADHEQSPEERRRAYVAAREYLRPVMSCHNGSTAPLMWLLGQSHIDLAWLWPEAETRRKSVRTYSNQLTLAEEYPEYKFLACEPALLEMLKKKDPDCWERTKLAVENGQMVPEGALYVECDTNMPSGESLIRQLLWGRRWYQENFGVDSKVVWEPDTFGFSAALPQIMKKMGVPYFATQKLTRVDPECEPFPYTHFIWEGMDGSEVLALSFFRNNSPVDPETVTRHWEKDRAQQTDIDTLLCPFGYGDGGGGPTRDFLELARREADLEGMPRTRYGGLREYFEYIEQQGVSNRWVGELYLNWHRGTYTSQRRQKVVMRRCEEALRHAEMLAAMTGNAEAREPLRKAWETVLFCQFHDVAAGAGIRKTHDDATAALEKTLSDLQTLIGQMEDRYFPILETEGLSLVNPLPFDRLEWVRMPDGSYRYVSVPACGVHPMDPSLPQPEDVFAEEDAGGILMGNCYFRFRVTRDGCITDLLDRKNDCPLQSPGQKMNDWRLYRNVQVSYDAWELDRRWKEGLIPEAFRTEIKLTVNTPQYAEVTVRRTFSGSTSVQIIRVMAATRRIDFETEVDWHERHRMLKTHFESNVLCDRGIHEIQFGYVTRPAHASTRADSDKYECCNQRYSALCEANRGFAVMNDGIYGVSSDRGELALTLLRAPLVPDDTNNQGHHRLTYALYPFDTSFAASDTVREGYRLNEPVRVLDGTREAFRGPVCESESVILETVKPAEDGQGTVLRLYESKGMQGTCVLKMPCACRFTLANMDESETDVPLGEGNQVQLTLTPFEIRTLRAEFLNGD